MQDSGISFFSRLIGLFRSIRFRLALWFVFILGVVILIFCVFVYTLQVRDLRQAAADRLEDKAEKLTGFLRVSSREYFQHSQIRIPNDPSSGESFLHEGDVLAFVDRSGKVIQSWGPPDTSRVSLWVRQGLQGEQLEKPFSSRLIPATIEIENSPVDYLVAIVPVLADRNLVGYFLVGNPIDPGRQLPRLQVSLGLGSAFTLLAAMLGGFWMADRAIHPVKQITGAARTMSETDLSRRLNLNRRDELGELADTFDGMLARLQAAFERQRQFTADASHELRTPLSIVELEAGRALSARRSSQEYERVLQVIKSENQFMIRLVNNLLTLARMDSGQVALNKEELDISDVALEVVERLAPLAHQQGVRLITGELPELPVLGDHQYLAQMISNLIENGVKYSSGESRQVEASTGWRETRNVKEAWLRIVDNGPGIPAEHLPLLFDRFYQVDKARTRLTSDAESEDDPELTGAGLGLSIAQWIAKAHDGEILVHSEPGGGSTFEVVLPLSSSCHLH